MFLSFALPALSLAKLLDRDLVLSAAVLAAFVSVPPPPRLEGLSHDFFLSSVPLVKPAFPVVPHDQVTPHFYELGGHRLASLEFSGAVG